MHRLNTTTITIIDCELNMPLLLDLLGLVGYEVVDGIDNVFVVVNVVVAELDIIVVGSGQIS